MPASRFRDDINVIGAPLTEICNRTYTDSRQRQLFKNIIYVGVLTAMIDMDVKVVEQLIGEARHPAFVGKLQSGLPVTASAAISAPPSSPKITRPVAVASVPPQELPGPGCGSSHLMAPVRISIAFSTR